MLRWFCHPLLLEELEGDLEEHFRRDLESKGSSYARRRYRKEVLLLFRPSVIKKLSNPIFSIISPDMLKNYFKVAIRNLLKNRQSSLINILGLAIGLAGCFLISLFVLDEWKFDQHHPEKDRLYRVYTQSFGSSMGGMMASTSPRMGPALKETFPEVEESLRVYNIRQKYLFKNEDEEYFEEKGLIVESAFFDFFHLPFKYGEAAHALNEPNSIVLTASLAEKYFGAENPVGQILTLNGDPVKVTAVVENPSPYFHLDFDFLFSFEELIRDVPKERIQSWVWQDFYNYIKLKPNANEEALEAKMYEYAEKEIHPKTKPSGFHYYPYLQKVTDIHLYSAGFRNDIARRSNHLYIKGLIGIGLFLLLIACINFINLTTAKALQRAKEVGVRKTTGALRSQLAFQFIGEATIVAAIATILAVVLSSLTIPYVNTFAEKAMSPTWFIHPLAVALLLGAILITGLLAGAYPAFIISGFKPIQALKARSFNPGNGTQWFRKGLVVLQFGLTILLIICVMVITQQIHLLGKKDLGFEKEQLLYFPMRGPMFSQQESVREEFSKIPKVQSVSVSFGIPGDIIAGDNIIVPGEDRRKQSARLFCVDHNYVPTMGMEIIAGRNFSEEIPTDASEAFIVNETAIRQLGLGDNPEDVIGKSLEWDMWHYPDSIKRGRIIGVVRDFHYASLHEEVQTAVLHIYPESYWKVALRVGTEDMAGTIAAVEKTWDQFNTGFPIDYQFVDEGYGAMYTAEQKWSSFVLIATILAIFIASIGTYALATYMTERRRKEIGIRKILGASTTVIVGLLSRHFIWMILIALIVFSPLAWFLMDIWLDDFAYRVPINWWIFPVAGLGAIVVAMITVGSQTWRAAIGNPVNSLRDE